MGIFQARVLEGVARSSSRESSQPRDRIQVSALHVNYLPTEPPGKPKNTGVGSLSLLQRIFPTQKLNQGLLYCRWILYQLSYEGSEAPYKSSLRGLTHHPGEVPSKFGVSPLKSPVLALCQWWPWEQRTRRGFILQHPQENNTSDSQTGTDKNQGFFFFLDKIDTPMDKFTID